MLTPFLLGAILLAASVVSGRRWVANGGAPSARFAVVTAHFAALSVSTFVAFGFALLSGLRCDESCNEASGSWRHHPGAWQWDAIGWLGLGGLVLTLAAVVFTVQKRGARSWLAFLAPAACYLSGSALYALTG